MIAKGADVHTRDNHGVTPLMLTDDENVCRKLIEMGVDVNAVDNQGKTALLHIRVIFSEIPSLLVKAGASVDATDMFGRTLLMRMTDYNSEDFDDAGEGKFKPFAQLLELGAEINAVDNHGQNAVMLAAQHNLPLVIYLIKRGAGITARDRNGKSVMEHAVAVEDISTGWEKEMVANMVEQFFYGEQNRQTRGPK